MTMMTMLIADADFDPVYHIILFDPKWETKKRRLISKTYAKKFKRADSPLWNRANIFLFLLFFPLNELLHGEKCLLDTLYSDYDGAGDHDDDGHDDDDGDDH